MKLFQQVNLALAFLLELAALGAYGYGGFQVQAGVPARVLCGLGAPLIVVVVWSVFLAPRARHRLKLPWLMLLKMIVFGGAVLWLVLLRHNETAILLGVLTLLNLGMATLWQQS